ncbi:MAG: DNA polymerase III subunit beta [Planctomycetaceae bacterium]|jgi:DNA polymerase-3 subunit beta|nr:DNA polymerase III subunit beta [Planctomycetaceae bacterium]
MKISCERDKFAQAFQLVASVAAVRDVKPILQNVKIKVEKKGVLLQATDTELGIRLFLDNCETIEKGEAILPTKRLRMILTESSEEKLQIESDQDKTIVSGTRSRFTLTTQPPDEFPDVENFSETAYHEIPAKSLREMIRRTLFATDTDNAKYALGGVFFELIDETIAVVATDGRRLAYQSGRVQCVNNHKVETSIFPARTLQLVEKALNDDEEPVKIAVSANRALFQYGNMVFFTRLVEGRFPRWRSIIPETEGKTQIEVLSGALFSAVRQAAVVTSDKQPGVNFVFESGKLELLGHGSEIGDSSVELPISYSGPKKELKLDPKYMSDVLKVLEQEKNLSLFLSDGDPLTIQTDDSYIYIVMPLSS